MYNIQPAKAVGQKPKNNNMETKTAGALKQDSKAVKTWLVTTDRFITDAIRGAGFTFNQTICEFTDNAIDAGAKCITVEASQDKDGYSIRITDDGRGIPKDKIVGVLSELGHGSSDDYRSDSISNYGVGMKYAIINLCEKGTAIIESRRDGWKSTIGFCVDGRPHLTDPKFEREEGDSYTSIFLPSVSNNRSKITSNQITALAKHFGAIYYPHIHDGAKLSIKLINGMKATEVEFSDPLYRELGEDNGIISNYDECDIEGRKIYIRGRLFLKSFDLEKANSYDTRQGGSAIAGSRSGIYYRLNGRYITLGGNMLKDRYAFFMKNLRIEVDIDRELIPAMGVGFNKSKITIDKESELLKPFIAKIDDIVSWAEKTYNKDIAKAPINADALEEREKLNKSLSAISKKTNGDGLKDLFPALPKKKKEKEDSDTKGTKNRPSGLEYSKLAVEVSYESQGKSSPAMEYGRINGKTAICINTDHPFYAVYSNIGTESKQVVDMMLFSMVEGLVATKLDHIGDEADAFREDFMLQMSSRLSKWFKTQLQ